MPQGGPVFVLTAHRSGGTALARGLNRHPDLMIWGEHAGFINKLAELDAVVSHYPRLTQPIWGRSLFRYVSNDKFDPGQFDPWSNPFEQADYRDWCRRYLEATFRRGLLAGQRWGFKEVRYHTPTVARFLLALFPDARFVILVRPLAALVVSNLMAPWSMDRLRQLGATTDAAALRAAVHDCAYALLVVTSGLLQIATELPQHCVVVERGALATPAATFATLFDFLGLPHWPALLAEVADMGERQFGVTDLSRSEGLLSFATIQRLLPEALAAAEAALRDTPPDLARLKRLGPTGDYSFLVGDHDLIETDLSSMF
jgi:hypothetical protein